MSLIKLGIMLGIGVLVYQEGVKRRLWSPFPGDGALLRPGAGDSAVSPGMQVNTYPPTTTVGPLKCWCEPTEY